VVSIEYSDKKCHKT